VVVIIINVKLYRPANRVHLNFQGFRKLHRNRTIGGAVVKLNGAGEIAQVGVGFSLGAP